MLRGGSGVGVFVLIFAGCGNISEAVLLIERAVLGPVCIS